MNDLNRMSPQGHLGATQQVPQHQIQTSALSYNIKPKANSPINYGNHNSGNYAPSGTSHKK